jgi:hypothetical protein
LLSVEMIVILTQHCLLNISYRKALISELLAARRQLMVILKMNSLRSVSASILHARLTLSVLDPLWLIHSPLRSIITLSD